MRHGPLGSLAKVEDREAVLGVGARAVPGARLEEALGGPQHAPYGAPEKHGHGSASHGRQSAPRFDPSPPFALGFFGFFGAPKPPARP